MEVKDLHQYRKDVEEVFKFFSEPDTIQAKYEGIGARNIKILECSESGGSYLVKIEREVPSDVPGILQKFLGAWNKVVQTEQWQLQEDGIRTCDLKVDIVGVPVNVSGAMTLRPEGEGCVNDVRLTVSCSIPLVGKKLAEFVAGDTKKSMDAEHAYIAGHAA